MTTPMQLSLSVIDELVLCVDETSAIKDFFAPDDVADFNQLLKRFLRSTMDQVRANTALQCTRQILKVSDLDDLELFREGVWKREARGVIKFPGQRDCAPVEQLAAGLVYLLQSPRRPPSHGPGD
jgi:hypothetical protein